MYSFTSDSKFLIITDTDSGEVWRLEKNQVSLKHINELVIIDRNGMHYKNVVYTQIVGNFASSALAVAYLETLVNTGQTVSIDTTGLATSANQTDGSQKTQVTNFPSSQNVVVTNTPNVNTGLSQPLTDTQLRATPVPVSGTITVDTSLLATESTVLNILNLSPLQVQKGLVSGVSLVQKSGRNTNVTSASIPEDMWNGSSVYTGFPTGSPETLQFFSSSASDTGTITYMYLATSASTSYQQATVTLNGTTPVSGVSAWRVDTAYYDNGGGTNIGEITCRHTTTTANRFFIMPIGTCQTYVAAYTIPAGCTGFLYTAFASVNTTNNISAQTALWIRETGKSPRLRRNSGFTNTYQHADDKILFKLPAGTDVTMRIMVTSSNTVQVYIGGFDIMLFNTVL